MKLLYLWVEKHKDMIKNQSFRISSSYNIDFDIESNRLCISRNKEYIENFYGNNILDVTAIVGENGVGKTTIMKSLYNICHSVNPVDDDREYPPYITKHIVVYEVEGHEEGQPNKLIVHYFLSENLKITNEEKISLQLIDLRDIKNEAFEKAQKEHDMTMVYFTNAFEVNHVKGEETLSEFSSWGEHKSLAYSPMMSLHKSFIKLREHYGSRQYEGGLIISAIEQYAQNMTRDFELPYAVAESYNYLIAVRYFPNSIARILPVMRDFKINITEFGQYIKYKEQVSRRSFSKMDWNVKFIRDNIYENIIHSYENNLWYKIYVNIICEIALFVCLTWDINFQELEQRFQSLDSNEVFEALLEQIEDNKENESIKCFIKRIKNVQGIDLTIIKEFINVVDRCKDISNLKTSNWYKQVENFLGYFLEYEKHTINIKNNNKNYRYIKLDELIIDQYNNLDTVYGRMINIMPPPMSSGEKALINIFATVYLAMKEETSGSILLMVDEIDAFLHPKWQQEILTHITRWINESHFFNNKKVQLVVATHSPIILSDIPKDKIIYLKEAFKTCSANEPTFGANISTLFYGSFLMDQGSIGAIARKEIQWAIDNIRNTNLNLDDRRKLVYIIDNIGDKFLREKLMSYPMYIYETTQGRDNSW